MKDGVISKTDEGPHPLYVAIVWDVRPHPVLTFEVMDFSGNLTFESAVSLDVLRPAA